MLQPLPVAAGEDPSVCERTEGRNLRIGGLGRERCVRIAENLSERLDSIRNPALIGEATTLPDR